MIEAGELPLRGGCAVCTQASGDEVPVLILCERYTARAYGGERFIFLPFFLFLPVLLFLPIFPLFILLRSSSKAGVEIRGRDTDVMAPMIFCDDCRRRLTHRPQAKFYLTALGAVFAGVGVGFLHILAGIAVALVGLFAAGVWWRLAGKSHQNRLKGILRQVPIYRQILQRYRAAMILIPPIEPPSTIPE